MGELRTDGRLLDALDRAVRRQPTAEELDKQRVSFIMGSMREESSVTKARISEVLAAQRGKRAN